MSKNESTTERLVRIQASLGRLEMAAGSGTSDYLIEQREEMKRLLSRRMAWEENQVVPSVPASLATIGDAVQFVFQGYAKLGTPKEAYEAQIRASLVETTFQKDQPELEMPNDDFGVFINGVGEMWRWEPKEPKQYRAQLRRQARLAEGATSADAYTGLAPYLADSGDIDYPVLAALAGNQPVSIASGELNQLTTTPTEPEAIPAVLGSTDSRKIRSATSGHCMTCYPWRAIGALNPNNTNGNNPNSQGTATKIGPRHLLTAAHTVHSGGSSGSWFWRDWWPGQDGMNQFLNGGDPSPNGVFNIQWYWVPNKWLNNGWASRDYAVLILYDSPQAVGLGWFGYKVDLTLANTSAWNFGYPGWGNSCENSPLANNSCRQSLWGHSAKITRTTIPYAFYKHDTQPGHSGGPIYQWNNGNRRIVAVHKGAYSAIENRGVKIRSSVFDNIADVIGFHQSDYWD
jgi:V8-like Glu-specific endopeptidase